MDTKSIVTSFFQQFFNEHDLSVVDHYLSPDYIQHDWDVPPGRDGFRDYFEQVFQRFPQFHVDVRHVIVDGDMVAVHGYGITDPGKIEVLVVDIYRMKDGQLAQAVAGVHGGGSPLMETICMMQRYPLEDLKAIAKYLAGIPGYEKCPRFERAYQSPRAMLAKFDASVAAKRK